ncbi:MAG: malate dehydrogenase, partial [Chlamydiota bacterium]|nr:malate dehydrogenase [Chlamydiota bacterium]
EVPSALERLQGVVMELQDGAFPLLTEITAGSDPHTLFEGVDVALLIGAQPRHKGMERGDLLMANAALFKEQGRALNAVAGEGVQVVVLGNPCNTNTLIALHHAPNIPPYHFHAVTQLDVHRAQWQVASHLKEPISALNNLFLWGNHSATQVPDFFHATLYGKPLLSAFPNREWLEGPFLREVQQRGAAIIAKRGLSSAASAAHALLTATRHLYEGEAPFSMGRLSDGNLQGLPAGLVISLPLHRDAEGEIRPLDIPLDDPFLAQQVALSVDELIQEREAVRSFLT